MDRHPDIHYIRKYVQGKLSPREMFELEKAAQSDELLMDVILGLEMEENLKSSTVSKADFSEALRKQVRGKRTTPIFRFSRPLAVAASAVAILSVSILAWKYSTKWNTADQVLTKGRDVLAEANTIVNANPSSSDSSRSATAENRYAIANSPDPNGRPTPTTTRKTRQQTNKKNRLDSIPMQITLTDVDNLPLVLNSRFGKYKRNNRTATAAQPSVNTDVLQLPEDQDLIASVASKSANMLMSRGNKSTNLHHIPSQEIQSITTGIIIDEKTKDPIANAQVTDTKTGNSVFTDTTGQFVLASTEESTRLSVQSPGFAPQVMTASGSVRVELTASQNTAKGAQTTIADRENKEASKTTPIMGNRAYRRYMDNLASRQSLGSGNVTLIFDINEEGRPVNVRIKESSGVKLDMKAIQLIKQGPAWKTSKETRNIEYQIRFK